MNRFCDTSPSGRVAGERGPKTPAIRTYRQIAEVLVGRGRTSMTAARVARICRAAESKFASAFLANPVLSKLLRPSAAQGR